MDNYNHKYSNKNQHRLSTFHGIAYASPTIAVYFLYGPLAILQGIYAKYFGLPLTTIATVLLIARLFDAVSDPLVGFLSDHYFLKTGSRKPFIAAGGVLFIVSSYFLFVPADVEIFGDINRSASFDSVAVSTTYFLGWFIIFYFSWTLFEIPHLAWGGEITNNSEEKSKVFSYRVVAVQLGQLAFFSIPLSPLIEENTFTPHTLKWSVIAAGVLMLPLLYLSLTTVQNGNNSHNYHNLLNKKSPKENPKIVISSVLSNKPLQIFLICIFFIGMGVGMWFSLLFIFADTYLDLGDKLPTIYVLSFVISTYLLGYWYKISVRWGKKVCWSIGVSFIIVGLIGTGALSPEDTNWTPLLIYTVLIYTGLAAGNMIAPSVLADIVDYGTWKFGVDRAATYFSFYTLIAKANIAIGGALGLAIAGLFGFDVATTTQSEDAVFGLRLAISWLPALITLISIIFIGLIPINAHRHRIISRRLEVRTNYASKAP